MPDFIKKLLKDKAWWLLPHFPINGPYGLIAEFETTGDVMHAAESVRKAGYKHFEVHSPFPIHGMDKAVGARRSLLPFLVLGGGLTGCLFGLGLQLWTSMLDYPLNISGKPDASIPAFIPVTFELTILFSAFAAVFGMFAINLLPQLYHPLFKYERFNRVTQDRFFISIQARDENYDEQTTRELLESLGGQYVAVVES